MRLGIDLDNTIISYDRLFTQLATERKLLPAAPFVGWPPRPSFDNPTDGRGGHPTTSECRGARDWNKQSIRDYLRAQGQEDCWTDLQGIAYGSRIDEAVPFQGVQDFFRRCAVAKVDWWIISHRSPQPYLGEPVDLHAAARNWLLKRGFVSTSQLDRVKLEVCREAKLRSILETGCDAFIDDLPELLVAPDFPAVRRILFDPADQNPDRTEYERATSWAEIGKLLEI